MRTPSIVLTRFDFHDHWFAILISHLLDVQQFMRVTIVPGPAVHKDPGATTTTVHHQAIVQVGVACVCCLHVSHPRQVPSGQERIIKTTVSKLLHAILNIRRLPMEVVFLSNPVDMSFPRYKKKVK